MGATVCYSTCMMQSYAVREKIGGICQDCITGVIPSWQVRRHCCIQNSEWLAFLGSEDHATDSLCMDMLRCLPRFLMRGRQCSLCGQASIIVDTLCQYIRPPIQHNRECWPGAAHWGSLASRRHGNHGANTLDHPSNTILNTGPSSGSGAPLALLARGRACLVCFAQRFAAGQVVHRGDNAPSAECPWLALDAGG